MRLHEFLQHRVGLVINKDTPRLDLVHEYPELLQVDLPGRKNVDVVPGDPGNDSDMWEKKMEFRPFFQGAGRVLVAFADDDGRTGNIYRLGKTFQSGPDQPVEVLAGCFQHMHDHGGGRGLAVAAPYYDPGLLTALLVDISGKGINGESQLRRPL